MILVVVKALAYLLGVWYRVFIFFSYSEPVIPVFIRRLNALREYLHSLLPLLLPLRLL